MSPETRAEAVVKAFRSSDQLLSPDGNVGLMEHLIASAITEAENDAMERAAQLCERRADANHDGVAPNGTCLNDAFAIRNLKKGT